MKLTILKSLQKTDQETCMFNIPAMWICFDRFVGIQDGEDATRATVKIIELSSR